MRVSLVVPILLAASVSLFAQQAMPRMTSVEPQNGKVGDVIAVIGENLHKDQVAKVYLTDGKIDIPVTIVDQQSTALKFKLPKATPGRFALMILTTGKDAKLIEQPVKLTVDEP